MGSNGWPLRLGVLRQRASHSYILPADVDRGKSGPTSGDNMPSGNLSRRGRTMSCRVRFGLPDPRTIYVPPVVWP